MSQSNNNKPESSWNKLRGLIYRMFLYITRYGRTPSVEPIPQISPTVSSAPSSPRGQQTHLATTMPPSHTTTELQSELNTLEFPSVEGPVNMSYPEIFSMDDPNVGESSNTSAQTSSLIFRRRCDPPGPSRRKRPPEVQTAPRRPTASSLGHHIPATTCIPRQTDHGFPGPPTPRISPALNDHGREPGTNNIIEDFRLNASMTNGPDGAHVVQGEIVADQVFLYLPYRPDDRDTHEDSDNFKDNNVDDDQSGGAANGKSSAKM